MERCPNCGATVRAGAKFCTTCGMRLPEMPAAESASPSPSTSRSPFESTSSVGTSRWPSERPSQGAAGDATGGYAVASEGSQPAARSDQPATDTTASAEESPAEADPSGPPAWPSLGRPSSWNSSWRSAAPETTDDASGEAEPIEAPAEAVAPEEIEAEEPQVTGTEIGLDAPVEAGIAQAAATEEVEEPVADEAEQVAAPADLEIEALSELEAAPKQHAGPAELEEEPREEQPSIELPEQQPGPADVAEMPAMGAGVDRAYALIDELRSVVTGLSGTATDSGNAAVADDLAAARSGANDDEFQRLRDAINGARDRPRDIDTMLDVSGRLDAIAALHDAYQQLATAVDGAIETLRPSAGAGNSED
ncbi:MAG: zinc-ribbon domain-containing protein [Thermomicrobiales bacterium]